MGKFTSRLLLVIGLATIGTSNLFSQRNFGFYSGFQNLSPSHYYNPSWNGNNKIYFSIGMGLHSAGLSNSGFKLKDFLTSRPQDDSLVVDPAGAINKLAKLNYLGINAQNEIIGFGLKKGKNYYSFGILNRLDMSFAYPKDFVQLIFEGNGKEFLGKRANLDGLAIDAVSYIEYGFGFNRELNSKWKVGGRVKLLSGISNVKTKKSVLGLTTDATTFDLTIDGEYDIRTAGIPDSNSVFDNNSFYNFKNRGVALDLGFTYKATEKITLNGSLLDVGSIKWTQNIHNYEDRDFSYTFQGVDINEALNDTNYFQTLNDSLGDIFFINPTNNSYRTSLPVRLIVGGQYEINRLLSTGVVWFSDFTNGNYRPTWMLAGSLHVKNWFVVNMNYTVSSRSANNVGLGIALKGGGASFFISSDNVLAYLWPSSAKIAHMSTGLGFVIGREKKPKIVEE